MIDAKVRRGEFIITVDGKEVFRTKEKKEDKVVKEILKSDKIEEDLKLRIYSDIIPLFYYYFNDGINKDKKEEIKERYELIYVSYVNEKFEKYIDKIEEELAKELKEIDNEIYIPEVVLNVLGKYGEIPEGDYKDDTSYTNIKDRYNYMAWIEDEEGNNIDLIEFEYEVKYEL